MVQSKSLPTTGLNPLIEMPSIIAEMNLAPRGASSNHPSSASEAGFNMTITLDAVESNNTISMRYLTD